LPFFFFFFLPFTVFSPYTSSRARVIGCALFDYKPIVDIITTVLRKRNLPIVIQYYPPGAPEEQGNN
jgi:hypothetical protein